MTTKSPKRTTVKQKTSKTASASSVPLSKADLKASIVKHLHCSLGTDENKANNHAWWKATCASVQEHVLEGLRKTQKSHYLNDTRAMHYFSAEFLMGRLMSNNLHNLGLFDATEKALNELGVNLTDIMEEEPDMALGNGGLGRLAACFIDSLATLDLPAVGYGLHYEHGLP